MMVQSIHTSLYEIGKYFPINIAARTLAYRFKNNIPSAPQCTTMVQATGASSANAA
jgi:hypothetical protein